MINRRKCEKKAPFFSHFTFLIHFGSFPEFRPARQVAPNYFPLVSRNLAQLTSGCIIVFVLLKADLLKKIPCLKRIWPFSLMISLVISLPLVLRTRGENHQSRHSWNQCVKNSLPYFFFKHPVFGQQKDPYCRIQSGRIRRSTAKTPVRYASGRRRTSAKLLPILRRHRRSRLSSEIEVDLNTSPTPHCCLKNSVAAAAASSFEF